MRFTFLLLLVLTAGCSTNAVIEQPYPVVVDRIHELYHVSWPIKEKSDPSEDVPDRRGSAGYLPMITQRQIDPGVASRVTAYGRSFFYDQTTVITLRAIDKSHTRVSIHTNEHNELAFIFKNSRERSRERVLMNEIKEAMR